MGTYLVRHAAVLGSLIAAGCSCLFIALSMGVLIGGPLVRFDRSTADALHTFASEASFLTTSLRIVGFLGSLEALAVVSVLVAGVLLVQRRWSMLAAWLVAVLGGQALNLLLKDLFARPRPNFERPLVIETSYSFPSGQAMEALVIYGMLAYFAVLTLRGRGTCAVSVVGAAALVVLVGFSRAYLGAHYVSDVVGGFCAGGAWLSAVITGWGTIRRHEVANRREVRLAHRETSAYSEPQSSAGGFLRGMWRLRVSPIRSCLASSAWGDAGTSSLPGRVLRWSP